MAHCSIIPDFTVLERRVREGNSWIVGPLVMTPFFLVGCMHISQAPFKESLGVHYAALFMPLFWKCWVCECIGGEGGGGLRYLLEGLRGFYTTHMGRKEWSR